MRVLLTGASSLTGAWMAAACVNAGLDVHVALRSDPRSYTGFRARRLAMLGDSVRWHSGIRHGDSTLARLIPNATRVVIPGRSHLAAVADPAMKAAAIEFLAGLREPAEARV